MKNTQDSKPPTPPALASVTGSAAGYEKPKPGSPEWRENAKKRIGWTKVDGCKWLSPEGETYYEMALPTNKPQNDQAQRLAANAPDV